MKCGEKWHKFEPTRFLCVCLECVLHGNIICQMCLGEKRIENNHSNVRTAISLCSTLFLLGKKGFLFFVWVSKPFLVAAQNCFPFSHLNANSIRPTLCQVPKLTLIIKNCLRCPRCLIPPHPPIPINSYHFSFLKFSILI